MRMKHITLAAMLSVLGMSASAKQIQQTAQERKPIEQLVIPNTDSLQSDSSHYYHTVKPGDILWRFVTQIEPTYSDNQKAKLINKIVKYQKEVQPENKTFVDELQIDDMYYKKDSLGVNKLHKLTAQQLQEGKPSDHIRGDELFPGYKIILPENPERWFGKPEWETAKYKGLVQQDIYNHWTININKIIIDYANKINENTNRNNEQDKDISVLQNQANDLDKRVGNLEAEKKKKHEKFSVATEPAIKIYGGIGKGYDNIANDLGTILRGGLSFRAFDENSHTRFYIGVLHSASNGTRTTFSHLETPFNVTNFATMQDYQNSDFLLDWGLDFKVGNIKPSVGFLAGARYVLTKQGTQTTYQAARDPLGNDQDPTTTVTYIPTDHTYKALYGFSAGIGIGNFDIKGILYMENADQKNTDTKTVAGITINYALPIKR